MFAALHLRRQPKERSDCEQMQQNLRSRANRYGTSSRFTITDWSMFNSNALLKGSQ